MHRALNILGWIGTAVVFAAVAVRFLKPEWDQYAVYAAWTGLGTTGIVLIGMIWLNEPRDVKRLVCLGLIVVGVVGLKLLGDGK